jgi:hypothetical protein
MTGAVREERLNDKNMNLEKAIAMEVFRKYPTPTSCDYKGASDGAMVKKDGSSRAKDKLCYAVHPKCGITTFPHPKFVQWLMGYSDEHLFSMLSAMQSYRRSLRRSSKLTLDDVI